MATASAGTAVSAATTAGPLAVITVVATRVATVAVSAATAVAMVEDMAPMRGALAGIVVPVGLAKCLGRKRAAVESEVQKKGRY